MCLYFVEWRVDSKVVTMQVMGGSAASFPLFKFLERINYIFSGRYDTGGFAVSCRRVSYWAGFGTGRVGPLGYVIKVIQKLFQK